MADCRLGIGWWKWKRLDFDFKPETWSSGTDENSGTVDWIRYPAAPALSWPPSNDWPALFIFQLATNRQEQPEEQIHSIQFIFNSHTRLSHSTISPKNGNENRISRRPTQAACLLDMIVSGVPYPQLPTQQTAHAFSKLVGHISRKQLGRISYLSRVVNRQRARKPTRFSTGPHSFLSPVFTKEI